MTDAPKQFTELLDWEEDDRPTQAETYAALRRSIGRTAGFGLKLLECTPSIATETIAQLREDLPDKTIAVLALEEAIEKLFERVVECIQPQVPDVLFIVGLEKSLVDDISPGGFGGEGNYYRIDRTPRILAHLNQNREKFRDAFDFCLVLVLPRFAHKYFVRQAKDFVDWGAGVFELKLDRETIERESLQAYRSGDYYEYLKMTEAERREKRIELQTWIEESDDDDRRSQLLFELGNLLHASQAFEDAVASFDRACEIKPDYDVVALYKRFNALGDLDWIQQEALASFDPDDPEAWNNRGIALRNLGQNEAAVASYDRTIEIKPNDHDAWFNRGIALRNLGQNEAAVASYDRALELKPDDHTVWYNRGNALYNLGQYEAAVANYDRALEIKPDDHAAGLMRGIALDDLGQYEAAVASYDRALEIKPDDHEVWIIRGIALRNLGQNEAALASYDRALEIKPDFYKAWSNRGIALNDLGQYEAAVASYDHALEIKPDKHEVWIIRGIALGNLGQNEAAVASYDRALEIKPDYHLAWYGKALHYALKNDPDHALSALQRAIELDLECRDRAKTDTDFDPIRQDPRFQTLINPNQP